MGSKLSFGQKKAVAAYNEEFLIESVSLLRSLFMKKIKTDCQFCDKSKSQKTK